MNLEMELFPDSETGQWGYAVPALSIVGTGCETKDEARRLGFEAIQTVLATGSQRRSPNAEIVVFNVEVTPAAEAG